MSPDELRYVTLQVLLAHLVIGPLVTTLEHRPKALNAVGVDLFAHVLADTVIDRLMVRQAIVGFGVVGADGAPSAALP